VPGSLTVILYLVGTLITAIFANPTYFEAIAEKKRLVRSSSVFDRRGEVKRGLSLRERSSSVLLVVGAKVLDSGRERIERRKARAEGLRSAVTAANIRRKRAIY
jgi:hypothetical protein